MSRKFSSSLILVALFALTAGATTQEKSKISEQHAALLNQTLKEVIDSGAKIFNDNGDHAGCYRMWQGSLMSIRPFVPADMKASIDKSLAGAKSSTITRTRRSSCAGARRFACQDEIRRQGHECRRRLRKGRL